MIKKFLTMALALNLVFLPTLSHAQESEPEATTPPAGIQLDPLPPLSYSIAPAGVSFTPKYDVYILLPETWAFINNERQFARTRFQLELDTKLSLQSERFQLTVDLQKSQIDYLNAELSRTNQLLIETQKQKSMSEWTPVIVVGAVILGMALTTATVYAVTNGEGVR